MKRSTASILLVDDDQVDVAKIKKSLQKINVTNPLYVANNGIEALTLLHDPNIPRPSIILLDLNMPKMNGLEFLEALRADPNLRTIPVVVLTNSDEPDDKVKAFQAHVAGYIVKPVTQVKFMETMAAFGSYWTMSRLPK